jgi:hypothetical protein
LRELVTRELGVDVIVTVKWVSKTYVDNLDEGNNEILRYF